MMTVIANLMKEKSSLKKGSDLLLKQMAALKKKTDKWGGLCDWDLLVLINLLQQTLQVCEQAKYGCAGEGEDF